MGTIRKAGAFAVPALAAAGAVGLAGPATPAGADPTGQPLSGDLTQDGILDRVTLGQNAVTCQVTVEPGLPSGGFGPAEVHDYEISFENYNEWCPDIGAVVDLAGDGVDDLVVGWYSSSLCSSGSTEPCFDVLTLTDFEVVGGYYTQVGFGPINAADLDADGLVDVYRINGNSEGFTSLLNTPSGELVLGPMQSSCGSADHYLGDFDEDGKADLAVSYYSSPCGPPTTPTATNGAKVVFDDGTEVSVFNDIDNPASANWYVEAPVDANDDGHLDIVAKDQGTGEVVAVFLGDGLGGFTSAK